VTGWLRPRTRRQVAPGTAPYRHPVATAGIRPQLSADRAAQPFTKDGEVLRTIQDARDYLLTLRPQGELRNHWQQACKLILDEADPADVTSQFHGALFMDSKLDLSELERMNGPRR
jgi:hypothetical protein